MSPAEFRQSLLIEQFAHPTAEWHPDAERLAAAADRIRLVEDAMLLELEAAS